MLKAIIFDFDGVIVESVDIKTQAFCEIFKDHPQHIEAIRKYQIEHGGISRVKKFKYIYKEILRKPLRVRELHQLCQQFEKLVRNKVVASSLVEGAKEALNNLFNKHFLFIVSGTPQKELRDIIRRKNLNKYFHGVFGSPREKKELVGDILRKNKLRTHEVLFVGDSITDLKAARATGVRFVARASDGLEDRWNDPYVMAKFNNLKPLVTFISKLDECPPKIFERKQVKAQAA